MKAIIMAGGNGTRLYDNEHPCPKVLREACGRPLISYVFDSIDFIPDEDITVVVGFMADEVKAAFPERSYALQGQDGYGTGYAVRCAIEQSGLKDYKGDVVILSGDVPCIKRETVEQLCHEHEASGNSCTMLTCVSERALPFGRIIRDADGNITGIREHKDCTPEERAIKELNVGLYVFRCDRLVDALGKINADNAAGEYYLTDVPKIMLECGDKVGSATTTDERELLGVNTPDDLATVEAIIRAEQKNN